MAEVSIFQKIIGLANAVKAGESLKDPAKWKDVQQLVTPFGLILAVGFQFMGLDVTEGQLNAISYGVGTFVVLLNGYFTAATSKKVAVLPKVITNLNPIKRDK